MVRSVSRSKSGGGAKSGKRDRSSFFTRDDTQRAADVGIDSTPGQERSCGARSGRFRRARTHVEPATRMVAGLRHRAGLVPRRQPWHLRRRSSARRSAQEHGARFRPAVDGGRRAAGRIERPRRPGPRAARRCAPGRRGLPAPAARDLQRVPRRDQCVSSGHRNRRPRRIGTILAGGLDERRPLGRRGAGAQRVRRRSGCRPSLEPTATRRERCWTDCKNLR